MAQKTALIAFALACTPLTAEEPPTRATPPPAYSPNFCFSERVVAGTPNDFMEVRHLILRGSNKDIGRKLAEIARDRHASRPTPGEDPLITRAQRKFLAANYPMFLDRAAGVADAFGLSLDDDAHDCTALTYLLEGRIGCSSVFYPPSTTADGVGILSRNYDYSTVALNGKAASRGNLASTSRPYIIEMYPDRGYPSLYVCAYDLLGAALDGINSEGLCVAILADDEKSPGDPSHDPADLAVGLEVTQVVRFLLDTCADVEQAKIALMGIKQYYTFIPCHYIVADRKGRSFVFENSRTLNRQVIVDGKGEPQITVNFLLHDHKNLKKLPREAIPYGSFNRYRTLSGNIEGQKQKLSLDFIKHNNVCVAANGPSILDVVDPVRTLWHSIYIPERRSMEIDFYLGDKKPDERTKGDNGSRRSGYLQFELRP